ncbi:hypothetical protein MMC26_005058 [Xylographa opegraphella]|nr:hypothetical protein [Xylographa opegraphella]
MAPTGANGDHADSIDRDYKEHLKRYETNGTISLPMEVFEKIYLNPQLPIKGELRGTFGNPTPLALMGFLLASTPLGCALMGWRGAGGGGAATIGVFYFFGGLLQIIGSVMEWIIGNTFPFVVFGSYGAFWLALGATLQPSFNAEGAYVPAGASAAVAAAGTAEFLSSFAFYLLFVGILTMIYMVIALRTNVVFVVIFFFLDLALFLLAAAYWTLAEGHMALGGQLEVAAGACVFVFCMAGWYLLVVQLMQAVDFPFSLPVGDLSTKFQGGAARRKARGDIEKNA